MVDEASHVRLGEERTERVVLQNEIVEIRYDLVKEGKASELVVE